MAVDLSSIINQAAGKETYGALAVEKRILRAGNRVMNLSNVSSVAVQSEIGQGRTRWWVIAVIFGLLGLIVLSAAGAIGVIPLAVCGFAVFMALSITDRHYLTIQTNDGFRTLFPSDDLDFLVKALDFLARKINDADRETTGGINFEKGSIGSLTLNAETLKAETLNQTADTIISGNQGPVVSRSTNTAFGGGNNFGETMQSGSGHRVEVQIVQFGALQDQVSQIRDMVAQNPKFSPSIAPELDELLAIMKTGAAKPAERSRVIEIAGRMWKIFETYDSVARVFAQVGDLVARVG